MIDRSAVAALIVAAGSGVRAGGAKQYAQVAGKAVLAHAVDALGAAGVGRIQVVIAAGQEAEYGRAVGKRTLPAPVIGGAARQQSARNGLEALAADPPSVVLIHDAARPFLPASVIERLLAALEDHAGAVPALAVVDTLARGDEGLGAVVPRDRLVRVQTPQAFRFDAILAAHRGWTSADATDDAQIARAHGIAVAVVEGDAMLDKLTYPADLARAEARLAAAMTVRTGLGFDVHAFAPGDQVWLGGIAIPHDRTLAGHSDADVVLHALTDALLGAVGAGDIGVHFPPSDAQWRGAPSWRFLDHARALVAAGGGRIDHVDLTVICETPKLGPHRAAMRARIAEILGLAEARVSVKATTTERLGFTGRGEGIAAQAIATVRLPEEGA